MRYEDVLPARPESIAPVRAAVSAFAAEHGADPETIQAVELAVSEAATNVVMHAYIEAPAPGEIRVEVAVTDGALHVAVEDSGRGVRPRPDSPGMGVGMMLMAQMCDELVVTDRVAGGALIVMRFPLTDGRP